MLEKPKMNTPIYYVDAFTDSLFSGNPAAVIFTDTEDSILMQSIASENNLSETAFIRKHDNKFYIRWFAPSCEIDLCGHATLASAYIFFNFINPDAHEFIAHSKKHGPLKVYRKDTNLYLDLPKDSIFEDYEYKNIIESSLNIFKPLKIYKGRDDLMVILENESDVINAKPDFNQLKQIPMRGIIITAPSNDFDFVSRCFYPLTGVDEDPVTGSAHTTLISYWSKLLNKKIMIARQASNRGGILLCEDGGSRVKIGGKAILYMNGNINI